MHRALVTPILINVGTHFAYQIGHIRVVRRLMITFTNHYRRISIRARQWMYAVQRLLVKL